MKNFLWFLALVVVFSCHLGQASKQDDNVPTISGPLLVGLGASLALALWISSVYTILEPLQQNGTYSNFYPKNVLSQQGCIPMGDYENKCTKDTDCCMKQAKKTKQWYQLICNKEAMCSKPEDKCITQSSGKTCSNQGQCCEGLKCKSSIVNSSVRNMCTPL